jgi:hypothetical protein
MRYLKAFIVGLLALVAVVFVIENIEVLRQTIQLRLNLYVAKIETTPLEVWVITLLSFALGAVLVLIYFIYDHLRQRQVIRQLKQNLEILSSELKRAGVAVEASSPGPGAPQEHQGE